jgi:hypothetical protein
MRQADPDSVIVLLTGYPPFKKPGGRYSSSTTTSSNLPMTTPSFRLGKVNWRPGEDSDGVSPSGAVDTPPALLLIDPLTLV